MAASKHPRPSPVLTARRMMKRTMLGESRAFFRTADELRVHRQQLYRRAAPVFRQQGYRDSPLKQLAAACGLSIPGLYRYFPSKRDLALFPLSGANRPTDSCFAQAWDDPVVHLRVWLDHAAWERSEFLLALRLGLELLRERGGLSDEHTETFNFHIGLLADLLRGAAPRLGQRRARQMAESLLAMSFGADAIGVEWTPAVARMRFVQMLAPDLIRGGASAPRLADTLIAEGHPPHGPCALELAPNRELFAISPARLTGEVPSP